MRDFLWWDISMLYNINDQPGEWSVRVGFVLWRW